jgi:CubicO group peptidase (beta-lactamase class C family)
MRLLPALLLCACTRTVYTDTDTDPAPDDTGSDAWEAVSEAFDAAAPGAPPTGMTLVVYNADGDVLYRRTAGGFEPDVRVPVASSSKLVSGLVLLRLVEQGDLSLTTTTGETLGWTGDKAPITLDHLGGFTSGFDGTRLCTYDPDTTLADCVDRIERSALAAAPGELFEYTNTHLHVAARMAEVRTGTAWNALFAERLAAPLGLTNPGLRYYTNPKSLEGDDNPLVAGGLVASVDEYHHFLLLMLNRGRRGEVQLIDGALVDRMFANPYAGATVGASPAQEAGLDYRYGFTGWLECEGAVASCDVFDSAGAFGMVPWVDRGRGYVGILAMEGTVGTGTSFGFPTQQTLRPLIEAALDGS